MIQRFVHRYLSKGLLLMLSILSMPLSAAIPKANRIPPNPLTPIIYDRSSWTTAHDLFFIHAIPKCGTHFILKTMQLMTGKKHGCLSLTLKNCQELCRLNSFLMTYQPFTLEALQIAYQSKHKVIAMIRDPRDALVSLVLHMRGLASPDIPKNTQRDFFTVRPDFDLLSLDDQIMSLIKGDENGNFSYLKFYKQRLGWALNPKYLMVKYEDLVGPNGGGDAQIQRQTLLKIAVYIQLHLSQQRLNWLANEIYLGKAENNLDGKPFKRSSIGNWKTFLNEEHKTAVKQIIGEELIRLGYEKDLNW